MDVETPNGLQVGLNPKVKNTMCILSAYNYNPKKNVQKNWAKA